MMMMTRLLLRCACLEHDVSQQVSPLTSPLSWSLALRCVLIGFLICSLISLPLSLAVALAVALSRPVDALMTRGLVSSWPDRAGWLLLEQLPAAAPLFPWPWLASKSEEPFSSVVSVFDCHCLRHCCCSWLLVLACATRPLGEVGSHVAVVATIGVVQMMPGLLLGLPSQLS